MTQYEVEIGNWKTIVEAESRSKARTQGVRLYVAGKKSRIPVNILGRFSRVKALKMNSDQPLLDKLEEVYKERAKAKLQS